MSLPAYESYQPAPERWLGALPAHWRIERMKYGLIEKPTKRNGKLPPGAISYGKVVAKDGDRISPETRETYQEVLSGEYLINPINLNYDLISLRTALSEIDVCVSPAYIVLRPVEEKLNPTFGNYLLHVFDVCHMKTLGAGVRQTITFKDIGQCLWPLPPAEEQTAIARFLDRETARIDSLIEKKGRFIELLKEKRAAVITHAVTKGLDPNAPMKESGSRFLKAIPAGWSLVPLKHITKKIGSGKTPSGGAEHYVENGVVFLRSQNIYDDGLRLEDVVRIPPETHAEMAVSRVRGSDVLLNITGGSIGRCALVPRHFMESNVNQHVCILRLIDVRLSEWVHKVMISHLVKEQISAIQTGAGREGLNFEQVGNIVVTVPPREISERLLQEITRQVGVVDTLIAKTERSIELLREKRSALITAAVTGKIDVRAAA